MPYPPGPLLNPDLSGRMLYNKNPDGFIRYRYQDDNKVNHLGIQYPEKGILRGCETAEKSPARHTMQRKALLFID